MIMSRGEHLHQLLDHTQTYLTNYHWKIGENKSSNCNTRKKKVKINKLTLKENVIKRYKKNENKTNIGKLVMINCNR